MFDPERNICASLDAPALTWRKCLRRFLHRVVIPRGILFCDRLAEAIPPQTCNCKINRFDSYLNRLTGFELSQESHHIKKTTLTGDRFNMVSHVDQNWKPLLEGLEQISLAVEEHILSEEDCDV